MGNNYVVFVFKNLNNWIKWSQGTHFIQLLRTQAPYPRNKNNVEEGVHNVTNLFNIKNIIKEVEENGEEVAYFPIICAVTT